MNQNRGIPRGMLWETRFFGYSSDCFEMPRDRKSWEESLLEAINSQADRRWNPSKPPTGPAKKLFREVRYVLKGNLFPPGLRHLPLPSPLKLYCTIGTRLDFFYGTDGFFEYRGKIAPFDLTTNHTKVARGPIKSVIYLMHSDPRETAAELVENLLHGELRSPTS